MSTAYAVAAAVTDPELPMLTLADLGVLREVTVGQDGTVAVSITPTYTGCPAMDTMRDDLEHALRAAGYPAVDVRVVLHPAWSTDWISADGRRKLAAAGIAPPGTAPRRAAGP
ncbi:MAG TPA: 1,2-phenylacetyl-CoA epoxidase subunit PaaD, partial [Pseudonocardiaceae bacterium]